MTRAVTMPTACGENVQVGFNANDFDDDGNPIFGRRAPEAERSASITRSAFEDLGEQATRATELLRRVNAAEARAKALERRNVEEELAEREERKADRDAARADREQAAADRRAAGLEARKTTKRFWITAVLSSLGLVISGISLWWAITTANKPPAPVIVPTPTVVIAPQPAPAQPQIEQPR